MESHGEQRGQLRCRHRYTIVAESRNKGIPHALYCIPRPRHANNYLQKGQGLAPKSLTTRPFILPSLSQRASLVLFAAVHPTCFLPSCAFSVVPFSPRHHARADTSWSRKHTLRTWRRMSGACKRNGSFAESHPSHHPPPPHHCQHSLPLIRHHHPWRTTSTQASHRSRACAMSCREWKSSRAAAATLLMKSTTNDPSPTTGGRAPRVHAVLLELNRTMAAVGGCGGTMNVASTEVKTLLLQIYYGHPSFVIT